MSATTAASGATAPVAAAVDVGSNSVRLLVVDTAGARLDRRIETTRLAAGVDAAGRLDDAAIARTVATIARFRDRWQELGATRVRITATSAARDAVDRDRLLDAVEAAVGVRPEVISGQEEAALAFAGATGGVIAERPTAVVDVGGGSTELVIGDAAGRPAGAVSMRLGCVRLTERALHHDPATTAERARAEADVAAELERAERELAAIGVPLAAEALIAVAGTATTIAALDLGLDHYDEGRIHGAVVAVARLEALRDELLSLDVAARAALGPMQPGRADVIHGGAIVLAACARRLGVAEVIVSERDGLDAVAEALRRAGP